MRRALVAAAAALSLAACGGGDESTPPDADELAAMFDCSGDSDDAPDRVSCETEDAYFGIVVYEDNGARDADVEAATSMGVSVLVGDRFMIDSSDPAALEVAQAEVGGEIEG